MKIFLKFLCLVILSGFIISCNKDDESYVSEENLLTELNALEDVSAKEITPENGFKREFAIDLTLPVDHNNPGGQKFVQRMYLSHNDVQKPMVVLLSGYTGSSTAVIELCDMLDANQLTIPHRGYEEAEIDPMSWKDLTLEQAAADNHQIIQLLKTIYKNSWISTGVSKGGMTALFLEYLYPDDADAVVAYSAPMVSGYPTNSIMDFIKTQGGSSVQNEIHQYQRKLLENRDSTLFYFNEYANTNGLEYTNVDIETALEIGVMEYAVYIWQNANGSPYYYTSEGLSVKEVFNRWAVITYPDLYADEYRMYENLFYYQVFTEFGYYNLNTEPVSDLLKKADKDGLKLLAPSGVNLTPDYEKIDKITSWLESSGKRIIYIYGANDPWSAAKVNPSSSVEALMVEQANYTHSVKIKQCDRKSAIYDKLEEWLGISVNRL